MKSAGKKINSKIGFTLVEVTIIAGIVILLFALSINGLLRVRINSNDGAALANIKAIAAALESYRMSNSVYTDNFNALIRAMPPHLSRAFTPSGVNYASHQGYNFYIPLVSGSNYYKIYAQPQRYRMTGTKFIVYDQSGVQTFDDYQSAYAYVIGGVSGMTGGVTVNFPPPPIGYR